MQVFAGVIVCSGGGGRCHHDVGGSGYEKLFRDRAYVSVLLTNQLRMLGYLFGVFELLLRALQQSHRPFT